jgi:Kef-type K+ transport system membrane component KefB
MVPFAPGSGVDAAERVVSLTLVKVALIVVTARIAGNLARRVGQPRAVGEILAGIALGPSVAGMLAPDAYRFIFQ